MPTATDPKDRARDAFADLDTPEKTAFVIEATFSTIGAALRETGQRLGEIITEFDPETIFRDMTAPAEPAPEARKSRAKAAAPKTSTAKKAAAKTAAATKPAARKTPTKPASKTAGRTRKKKDDDA